MAYDEGDLIKRSRCGEIEAFDLLVRLHQDRIYNLAYRITGNREDASDAAQEAFVRAYQAMPRYRDEAAFSTWLHRIATNAALDLVRRRPASPQVELSAEIRAPEDPEATANRREINQRVHAALGRLTVEYRAAVVLRDLQGLAYDEIARILAIPLGTVRSRLARGREAMRAQLIDLVRAEG